MTITASILIPPQAAYDIARAMRKLSPKPLTREKWLAFLRSEHSPIRVATYRVNMQDIPAWVSVHFARHKIGVEHFVTSNREDITGRARTAGDTVDHIMVCNAQALISMARKRLCYKAADETREVMEAIWQAMLGVDSVLAASLVPDCIYRGKCNEFKPCGRMKTIVRPPAMSGGNYETCPNCGINPMWRETETIDGRFTGRAVCARCKQ